MSVIICDNCGDSVDITADRVELPFTCQACEDAVAKFSQDVEPAKPLSDEQTEVAKFYEKIKPASEYTTEPSDEFATVENTTALITDLELQLGSERALTKSLLSEVEGLKATVNRVHYFENMLVPQLRADLDARDADIRTLQERNDWQRNQINRQVTYIQNRGKTIDLQAAKIRELHTKIEHDAVASMRRFLKLATAAAEDIRVLTEQRGFWKYKAQCLDHELEQERLPWYIKLGNWINDIF